MAYLSEELIAKLQGKKAEDVIPIENIPLGAERVAEIRQRVNQSFFRSAVLTSYNSACCITGINNPELLLASHIKPWRDSSPDEKTNPQNGLCLNALHDKAFDNGFITVTPDLIIHISSSISDIYNGETVEKFFKRYNNVRITAPEKFAPSKEFLEYHNDTVFENWR